MQFRIVIAWVMLLCIPTLTYAQDQFYYTDGIKYDLTMDKNSMIIHTDDLSILQNIRDLDEDINVVQADAFDHKGFGVIQLIKPIRSSSDILELINATESDIRSVSSGFQFEDGYTMWPTHRIAFKLRDRSYQNIVDEMIALYKGNYTQARNSTMIVEIPDIKEVFELSALMVESGLVEFAHPDFYAPIEHHNDPLYPQQFQMNNTGQSISGIAGVPDMDCNAAEAWTITLGSSDIVVAVIDDGLEDHEDLEDGNGATRIIGGFTPANNGDGGAIAGSEHAVPCAGIIAATHNNGIGVRGVTPVVDLLSLNIFFGGETTQDIADAFTWAKDNGADVMSNSWGFTSCTANYANINNAMVDANDNGRNGKGCVLAFSSGNGYNDCVNYPAKHAEVLAVGAFTH